MQSTTGTGVTGQPTISGVVLALNAEGLIDDCLASLSWTDEQVVLVDAETTDATSQRAAEAGARVHHRTFTTFADQRNAALELASGEWTLFVDSDERVTPALAQEIRETVEKDALPVGYWVPRRNIICGRWVKNAGWYPDYQLRLLRRSHARYDDNLPVHEVATLNGASGSLTQPLVHLNYRSLAEFWLRQRRYARLAAKGMLIRGEHPRARSVIGQPTREFLRRYMEQGGYKEGALGLALCTMVAAGTLEAYARALLKRP
jgi:glycosyltransferase involved in cell wall biosynthesis